MWIYTGINSKPISTDFNNDLEWLKKLRNDIEHFKFELDAIEVRNVLGRLIRATDEFNDEHGLIDISSHLGGTHLAIYEELRDEYKAKLATARIAAKAESEDCEGHLCGNCGESAVEAKIRSELHCKFCEEIESLIVCCHCDQEYREDEVMVWNDDHPPHVDYMCEYCYDHIMNRD